MLSAEVGCVCKLDCACRVAVLDGGLPLWINEGYQLDESPVSDENLNAPLTAAQHPPFKIQYSAHLQVSAMQFLTNKHIP